MNHQDITEAEFLKSYDSARYKSPSVAVDSAIFTIKNGELCVLLIQRAEHPYLMKWSLIGGYVNMEIDKSLEDTAKRKLKEKTSVQSPYLEQVMTVGSQSRDPRGWTVTTTYFALLPWQEITLNAGNGAHSIKWDSVGDTLKRELAFDHSFILEKSLERLRAKTLYTTLPIKLMQGNFTLSELQRAYEIVLGAPIQAKSFRRRLLGCGALEETGERKPTGKRPALLYRADKDAEIFYFPRNLESIQLLME